MTMTIADHRASTEDRCIVAVPAGHYRRRRSGRSPAPAAGAPGHARVEGAAVVGVEGRREYR